MRVLARKKSYVSTQSICKFQHFFGVTIVDVSLNNSCLLFKILLFMFPVITNPAVIKSF